MPTLLVIDDEPGVQYSFQRIFEEGDVEVVTASTAAEGLNRAAEANPDVIVLDLQLPDRSGLEVFEALRQDDPRRPVIFITAHGTTASAIEAMKQGAFDYLVKPVELERLMQVLDRAWEAARLMRVPAMLPVEDEADQIIGRSAVMQEMCKLIGRLAPQDVNVLIVGESGTGKELVARALYHHSRRADQPFLAINCAALPETLLESELFGHEAGAFTGAVKRRIGKFEQCDGGTLFLDEIGDMPPAVQAKMLRIVQDQTFERVGGNETVRTNVRLLFATNQDLEKLVEEGKFRRDLFFRLRNLVIQVPPLRERLDDVPELAHYFLFRFNRQLGLDLRGFSPEALDLMQRYSWPGNVRELQGAVQHAMLHASGHIIIPEFLPPSINPATATPTPSTALPKGRFDLEQFIEDLLATPQPGDLYGQVMQRVERLLFSRVLAHTQGRQSRASEILGLNRTTLRNKLRSLGMHIDRVVSEGDNPEAEADPSEA
ncbi:MAG: sigma-54 dependent transcriptional regulator [Gemmatales bacterium]|nr:sigma-54 dependent transcriptional regulator [Gemmatales bacterium]MDW8386746.1 sigma-54 dependent transcriptional regulator [Gemmatales bacterium]